VYVHRVRTTRFGRGRLVGRAIDYASFYLSATLALAGLARAGDIVVAMTDPPLTGIPAALVCRLRGSRLVNWVQDVFPEIADRMGVALARGLPGAALRSARNWSLRSARANVVLGERMRDEVRSAETTARIKVIHNWADGSAITPVDTGANALRREWGLVDRFVVAYSGNMGRAHEFETILGAADLLRDRTDVVFLFIGDGHQREWIATEASARKLTNVRFQPYQPRERLASSLGVADVHLTSLPGAMEGLLVPSKIYGILAAGRAALHVGDPDGEVARILSAAGAGYTVNMGDPARLAGHIAALASDPGLCARLGSDARKAFDAHYTRDIAFAHWARVLREVSGGRSL
jgi:glycosyltransferase involved in cell wall biosynthesis